MDEVLKEFLTESREGLDQLDADFITLEKDPGDQDTLARVFRTIHTIKGTCGFLGFGQLEKVTHAGESLLALLRDGTRKLDEEITGALLAMVDAVRTLLERIEKTGLDAVDYSQLVAELTRLQQQDKQAVLAESLAVVETSDAVADSEPVMANDEMAEVLKEFLTESQEGLDQLDSELVRLEQNPDDTSIIASIFRTIHTIKGTCGFLGFARLEKVAHAGESLLALMRDGKLQLDSENTDALLAMVDAVRNLLAVIERDGHDGNGQNYEELIKTLTRLQQGPASKDLPKATPTQPQGVPVEPPKPSTAGTMGDILVREFGTSPDHIAEALALQDQGDPRALGEILVEKGQVEPKTITTVLNRQREAKTASPPAAVDTSIRVSVTVLDKLMNLVGELVLVRNQAIEYASVHEQSKLSAIAQRLNLLTSDLQEGVMQTRMQPIHNIWAKIPRVVRDLAVSCGKKIRVEMEGKETELDKSLIEAMKDPLTHLVRNAVDHGIETPEIRHKAGKPEEGCLLLRAYHEGGQVYIEISDDGSGIDADKIRNKALQKGLITSEQAAKMSESDAQEMIFMAGLSTAEKVTNISGRGVGMDVVKTNIEKINGTVGLDSKLGYGTTFKIALPLTLAIVPALIITSGGERFAIPQANVLELIRLDEERCSNAIEYIHGVPVYRLRNKLLPVVFLNSELGLVDRGAGSSTMVVLHAEQRNFILVVDQIIDTQEIVIKPLAEVLRADIVFAGATIMGDGRVALILDTPGLAQKARVLGEARKSAYIGDSQDSHHQDSSRQKLLIVRSPGNGRLAIPLSKVARIEEIDPASLEGAGAIDVIQYRGQILPLIPLRDVLGERRNALRLECEEAGIAKSDLMQVVVFGERGRSVGLVVDEFLDVSEEIIEIKGQSSRLGVSGTAVIQGRVTELFDVETFLNKSISFLDCAQEA